jgi:hypothetical protein
VDGHGSGAEHHGDIDANLLDRGQRSLPLLCANRATTSPWYG